MAERQTIFNQVTELTEFDPPEQRRRLDVLLSLSRSLFCALTRCFIGFGAGISRWIQGF